MVRLSRIYLEDRQFEAGLRDLFGWLGDRGYGESFVTKQIDRACRMNRRNLLRDFGKKPLQEMGS